MIKTKRLIALLFAAFAFSSAISIQAQTLDIDRQLKYCSTQVHRALDELRRKDGTYATFSMATDRKDGTADRLKPKSGATVSGQAYCG